MTLEEMIGELQHLRKEIGQDAQVRMVVRAAPIVADPASGLADAAYQHLVGSAEICRVLKEPLVLLYAADKVAQMTWPQQLNSDGV